MKGLVNPPPNEPGNGAPDPVGNDVDTVALQLKKQARRRLIGAIALALFGVITLPMMMDSQPRPTAPEIQVHIPDQDGVGLAAKIVPGAGVKATPMPTNVAKTEATGGKPGDPVAANAPSATAATNQAAPNATAAVASQPTTSAKPTPGADKPVADSGGKPAPKTAQSDRAATDKSATASTKPAATKTKAPEPGKTAGDQAAATASGATTSNHPDEPRALAALTGTESISAPWMVQLGAYKEAGNVKVLVAKVKEMKLPVTTEKYESSAGPRTRVRAGPFATRAEAEKAQARIRTIGVVGTLSQ